jgi:hypothetical protein
MKISIGSFKGMAPKLAPNLIPDEASQVATNVRVTSGSLRALNTPSKASTTITPSAASIYSLGPAGGSYMLSWATDTDVARSPISDSEYRIYYTNGTAPKKTNLTMASGAGIGPFPVAEYNMGVPRPTAAPTAAAIAGTNLAAPTTWVYCYTHVTQFGSTLVEESAPSPSVTITTTAGANQDVRISGIADPVTTTGYNYIGKRLYRSSGTTLQLVSATLIPLGTTTYDDHLGASAIAGDALLTSGWLPPANDLKGIVSLPSGTMAAFRENEIWFCEPGYPHAWPVKYMQALESKIVAIWAFGNNLAVATQTNPYVGSGVYPDSFTFQKIPRLEPCVSKRSMAGDETGAIYASANGLVSIGLGGDSLITESVLTRQEFNSYYPYSMTGAVFEGRYYGFYDTGSNKLGFVFSPREQSGMRTVNIGVSAATIEPLSGQLLYIDSTNNALYSLDPTGTVPMTYTWKSKVFRAPQPVNMGYVQVLGREDSTADVQYAAAVAASNAAITAANAVTFATGALYSGLNDHGALNEIALNDSTLQALTPSVLSTVTLYVYAGSDLRFYKELDLNKVYTLPSGFKSLGWELMIVGQREVMGIEMANSVTELRSS